MINNSNLQSVLNSLDVYHQNAVFIMRGLPGSGKSTAAKDIAQFYGGAEIVSADDYFIDDDGVYRFDASAVPNNHHWCLRQFISNIKVHRPIIVVDNTNLQFKEYHHYVKIAAAYGYQVIILTFNCSVEDSLNVTSTMCLKASFAKWPNA